MVTSLLTSSSGQKIAEYKAKKGLKRIKKYCSAAFEGILWVMVILAFLLITVGGILNFIPTGIKYIDAYPIGNFMNMPIGIYALVYVVLFIWPAIPFPLFQRKIPVLNLFQKNFLVRGLVLGILVLGLGLTLATAFGAALMALASIGYILVYFLGFQPKWVLDEAEQAEYQKVESGEDVGLKKPEDQELQTNIPNDVDEDEDW
jgi:hypothetical protein